MTILDVGQLSHLVSTALATYGTLNDQLLKETLVASDGGANFTSTQADAFINRYELRHQLPNQLSGFSATLFWDKLEEKHVLAIRGTELDLLGIPTDGISADFSKISWLLHYRIITLMKWNSAKLKRRFLPITGL